MEIFQEFGINWYLVVAQIVNFLIILYLFKRYVYKPVFNMLKKRADIIKQSIDDAQKTKDSLEKTDKERTVILKKAREEAKKIIDESTSEAQEIIEAANQKAKKQSDVVLADAQEEIDRQAREAEKRIQGRIGNLVEKILQESLSEYLSEKEQKEIIAKTLKRIPVSK